MVSFSIKTLLKKYKNPKPKNANKAKVFGKNGIKKVIPNTANLKSTNDKKPPIAKTKAAKKYFVPTVK